MPALAEPKTLTQADLKDDVDELVDMLVNGTGEHSLAFAERLAAERAAAHHTHGMFKTWSVNNRLFLEAQSRRRRSNLKGLFAGVDQWRKLNREVVEDQVDRPYIIWGSPVYTVRADDNGQAGAGQAAPGAQAARQPAQPGRQMRFRKPPVLPVYDWTQTRSLDEDYEEPDWDVPLGYGDLTTLATLVESSPVPVRFADLAARTENGWLDTNGITVNDRMEIGNKISTLAHELGHHHLGHLDVIGATTRGADAPVDVDGEPVFSRRAVCEQEAGLVQWLVMKMLGLDESVGNHVTEQAAEYLSSWTKHDADGKEVVLEGKKSRRRLLTKRLDSALKAADEIVRQFVAAQQARLG